MTVDRELALIQNRSADFSILAIEGLHGKKIDPANERLLTSGNPDWVLNAMKASNPDDELVMLWFAGEKDPVQYWGRYEALADTHPARQKAKTQIVRDVDVHSPKALLALCDELDDGMKIEGAVIDGATVKSVVVKGFKETHVEVTIDGGAPQKYETTGAPAAGLKTPDELVIDVLSKLKSGWKVTIA